MWKLNKSCSFYQVDFMVYFVYQADFMVYYISSRLYIWCILFHGVFRRGVLYQAYFMMYFVARGIGGGGRGERMRREEMEVEVMAEEERGCNLIMMYSWNHGVFLLVH